MCLFYIKRSVLLGCGSGGGRRLGGSLFVGFVPHVRRTILFRGAGRLVPGGILVGLVPHVRRAILLGRTGGRGGLRRCFCGSRLGFGGPGRCRLSERKSGKSKQQIENQDKSFHTRCLGSKRKNPYIITTP